MTQIADLIAKGCAVGDGWARCYEYKTWTTDMGYIFLAKDLKDAQDYMKVTGMHLGTLKEVVQDEKTS